MTPPHEGRSAVAHAAASIAPAAFCCSHRRLRHLAPVLPSPPVGWTDVGDRHEQALAKESIGRREVRVHLAERATTCSQKIANQLVRLTGGLQR
jgi:hypothetical protein